MLTLAFSNTDSVPPLHDEISRRLWEYGFVRNKGLIATLGVISQAAGLVKENELSPADQRDIERIFELLVAARHNAEDFLDTNVVPECVYQLLAARTFLEMEDEFVTTSLPKEVLLLHKQVKTIEENPNEFIGDYSPARFCQQLFEWQEMGELSDALIRGKISITDQENGAIERYILKVNIPMPKELPDPTKLEIDIAQHIVDIGFLINHFSHPDQDKFWYIPFVAETPAAELNAGTFMKKTGWDKVPEVQEVFEAGFNYCLEKAHYDRHRASHLFVQSFIVPMHEYLMFDEDPQLSTCALAFVYSALISDPEFRDHLYETATDKFKRMVGLACPTIARRDHIPEDPDMMEKIQKIGHAHYLTTLFYRQSALVPRVVPIAYIRDHLLTIHHDICTAQEFHCPESMAFYRKSILDQARKTYSQVSSTYPEFNLPFLPPSPFKRGHDLSPARG